MDDNRQEQQQQTTLGVFAIGDSLVVADKNRKGLDSFSGLADYSSADVVFECAPCRSKFGSHFTSSVPRLLSTNPGG